MSKIFENVHALEIILWQRHNISSCKCETSERILI